MRFDGIHHITAITGDAPRNVDFYTRVLGLRLTAKSVNQDDPSVYHLFFGDEEAQPGADLTFFEYRHARPGRVGAGMIHPTVLRNGGYDPDKVTGFAFGMGPQRMLMLKHAIDDIRLFWQNDLRFLKQFN